MTIDDREYYLSRAVEEDKAAERASCAAARGCHEQLAALYRARCTGAPNPLRPASRLEEKPNAAEPIRLVMAA